MREYLERLPKEIRDLIKVASSVAGYTKQPIYLVGGFVRDLFLGAEDFDLDIVVAGDGIKFAEQLAKILNAKLICHRRFGTATLFSARHRKIDVASARKEFYPAPAHLPVVSPGSIRDDLFRRDFTINAMAIGISADNFGQLLDYFGGRQDLKDKKIRILHDLSFIDDPTRILRAIRFEQRYNFRIESRTLRKIKEAVKLRMLEKVDAQRIRDEVLLMLKEENPLRQIKRLDKVSGFSFLSPGLVLRKENYLLMRSAERQMCLYSRTYPLRRHIDKWLVYFMCIIDSFSISEARRLCRRLALRQGEEKRIISYKKVNKGFLHKLSSSKIKPAQIYTMLQPLSYEVILLLKVRYPNQVLRRHIQDFFKVYNDIRIFASGHDLHRLGLNPGPEYKKIFTAILEAKLNGQIKTKKDELTLINKFIRGR